MDMLYLIRDRQYERCDEVLPSNTAVKKNNTDSHDVLNNYLFETLSTQSIVNYQTSKIIVLFSVTTYYKKAKTLLH